MRHQTQGGGKTSGLGLDPDAFTRSRPGDGSGSAMRTFGPGASNGAGRHDCSATELEIVTVAGAFNIELEIIGIHIVLGLALKSLALPAGQIDRAASRPFARQPLERSRRIPVTGAEAEQCEH